jgi:serine/threonine protein phosphatase PrpC
MLSLHIEWLSQRGGRDHNEDACGHWQSPQQLCAVLADGAGGHGGGDIASKMAVRELVGRFSQHPTASARELGMLLRDVNDVVLAEQAPGTVKQQMHSTVVCLVINVIDGQVHWAHAGDSRMYWFREGRLLQRTRDHSLVQSLVDAGIVQPEQLRKHPQRSELRSALGVAADVLEVDVTDGAYQVQQGDAFLLCTDGFWEYIDDHMLEQTLSEAFNPRVWLDALSDEVRRAVGDKTRYDNFTAIAVWADGAQATCQTS